ncbi:putative RNA 2'-phosphotransferase [Nocardiopsis terrae]|uniref:Probable RNA 2'-phosphotransferase n=1 Tax=Nocardiopsis terrae TaxID=372655 RepID=A0ABR9H9T8_9ACTN|nr:RNA 2'-phosphotransferase [Nocardiopsis terrae]MBE1455804.1 putative RNA 2'-phosphotransferase [Nocardiopsis terrae]GHC92611.1 putative RNA 2'-phosphotransferase [Nocardiopsis terrae]
MNDKELHRASRFLALVLRHDPARAGLTLDPQGWTGTDALVSGCRRAGLRLTPEGLREIVETNDRKRFALSPDGLRIRAQQGHSVRVDLRLEPTAPPTRLFHGTVGRFLPAIHREGLRPMNRHHMHLSPAPETARRVGARRGTPVVVTVDSARMHAEGHEFRLTGNGVWLADAVPPEYLVG